jgi:hypothetical protein
MMTTFRRRTERISATLPVSWKHRGKPVQAIAADINEHGMFIKTEVPVDPGQLLQISIALPDGPLSAFITVRFVGATQQGQGFGAELFLMMDDARDRWSQHYRAARMQLLLETEEEERRANVG